MKFYLIKISFNKKTKFLFHFNNLFLISNLFALFVGMEHKNRFRKQHHQQCEDLILMVNMLQGITQFYANNNDVLQQCEDHTLMVISIYSNKFGNKPALLVGGGLLKSLVPYSPKFLKCLINSMYVVIFAGMSHKCLYLASS